jgi:hypothetical protein
MSGPKTRRWTHLLFGRPLYDVIMGRYQALKRIHRFGLAGNFRGLGKPERERRRKETPHPLTLCQSITPMQYVPLFEEKEKP